MTTDTTDAEAIAQAVADLEEFINEPPQYEDQRMVRDYRHETYRKWSPVRDAILSLLASRREAQEPECECPTLEHCDGSCNLPPAPAGGVERLLTEMQPHIDKIERCADANDEWGRVVTGQTDAAREIARIARAALNGGQSE